MTATVSLSALFRKTEAKLSRGVYERGASVRPENRSRYNSSSDPQLSMGIVEAILAVLTLHVANFGWRDQGMLGRATLYSTSKRPKENYPYQFTWDERDRGSPLYGGFENGLTYQFVVLHLISCSIGQISDGSARSTEVMERWFRLVEAMQRLYPMSGGGWTESQVAAACRNRLIQPGIEQVADALWFSIRYQLPDKTLDRQVTLFEGQMQLSSELEQMMQWRSGADLLQRPREESFTTRPSLRPRRMEEELKLDKELLLGLGQRENRMEAPFPLQDLGQDLF